MYPNTRIRRLRRSETLRNMLQETRLQVSDLIYPLFIKEGLDKKQAITTMPGQFQFALNDLNAEIESIQKLKIPALLLFGIPKDKDQTGSFAYCDDGIVQQAIRKIKKIAPEIIVIADVCCCEYTDHGHCGPLSERMGFLTVDNDATLEVLAKQVVSLAKAGVDMVAPSGMIDGMVLKIRQALDQQGFEFIPILSYAVKFASSAYGPFRGAAESTPQSGDRKSYQMNPANVGEALREVSLDVAEGADFLMVKPALFYLDIICRVKQKFPEIPLAAYQVSGEYVMIKTAAQAGLIDERPVVLESLLSIKRAGADLIISYFAKEVAQWLLN